MIHLGRYLEDALDLCTWWIAELRAISPVRPSTDVSVLTIDRAGYRYRRSGEVAPQPCAGGRDDLLAMLRGARAPNERKAILVVDRERYLERRLADFRLPRRRAARMATMDIASATPLKPDEILLLLPERWTAEAGSRYFVVKLKHIQPAFEACSALGIKLKQVQLTTNSGEISVTSSVKVQPRAGRARTLAIALNRASAVAITIVGVFTLLHLQHRDTVAAAELDARIEAASSEVKIVRRLQDELRIKINQTTAIHNQQRQARSLTSVLAELTRIVPDSCWITDLSFSQDRITFSGYAEAATDLIATLEYSPLFRSPSFSGQISRTPGMEGDRFTMIAEMEL